MKSATAFSAFGVTAAVLGMTAGLALRTDGAQAASGVAATPEAHFQFMGLTRGELAQVHVVNLSPETGLFHRFTISFINRMGMTIKPEEVCEVRAGETCSVGLTPAECMVKGQERCEFRAMVVADPLKCPSDPNGGGASGEGKWSTNLEVGNRLGAGIARVVTGPNDVLIIPRGDCTPPGSDDPGSDFGTDDPGSDFGTDDPGSDFGTDFPGSDDPGTDGIGTDFR